MTTRNGVALIRGPPGIGATRHAWAVGAGDAVGGWLGVALGVGVAGDGLDDGDIGLDPAPVHAATTTIATTATTRSDQGLPDPIAIDGLRPR